MVQSYPGVLKVKVVSVISRFRDTVGEKRPQVIFSGLVYVVAVTRWRAYGIVGFRETWARILHRKLRGEAYWMSHLPWSWPDIRLVKGLSPDIRSNDSISQQNISAFTILATSFMKRNMRRGLQFERGQHLENVICQARDYFVLTHAATSSRARGMSGLLSWQ